MTTIAWDGKTLAGDRMGDANGLRREATKIFRIGDCLFGGAGMASKIQHLKAWIENGADPDKCPAFQLTDDYQSTILIRPDGSAWSYAQSPYPFRIEDRFHAIGSGRDFAITAMHLGRNAVEAVEIACKFDTGSGIGVDALTLISHGQPTTSTKNISGVSESGAAHWPHIFDLSPQRAY